MNTLISLQNKAIEAAKNANWDLACAINEEIIALEPSNLSALNRLAVCHLQKNELNTAKGIFHQVLALDPTNPIARKQLSNLKQNIVKTPSFSAQHFIEEPGRSKVITLHRLAVKNILEQLQVGQELSLKNKTRYVSVETTEKVYVGSLPEDISLRLTKLLNSGNLYQCQVHSFSYNACTVFIKELFRSPENIDKLSFAVNKVVGENNDFGDDLFIENDIPLNIHETDADQGDEESDHLGRIEQDQD